MGGGIVNFINKLLLFVALGILGPFFGEGALNVGYYYSTSGGFNNTCGISSCDLTQCQTGFYLSGCVINSPGSCVSCGTPPTNGLWGSNGKIVNTASCDVTCNSGYSLSSGACVSTKCTNTLPANAYYTNTTQTPNCPFKCNDGYYPVAGACSAAPAGTYSTGGATPVQCSAGFFSTNVASTACSKCVAGTFSLAGYSQCTAAAAGYYVPADGASTQTACAANAYSASTGATACTTCTTCDIGQYKQGCGGGAAGYCSSCSN